MKKVLVASAALMLAGGMYVEAASAAAAVTPGVVITGDARARIASKSDTYDFNDAAGVSSQVNMDSRVRLNFKGTSAGGAYAFARLRIMEQLMGDMDNDTAAAASSTGLHNNNLWADQAFFGIPFTDAFTAEVGKYRSTYGPMGTTYNFFYDDVNLAGARGIIKVGDNIVINPFAEWMDEAQNTQFPEIGGTYGDTNFDHDSMRFGAHVKAKVNKDWTVGGMLGYQNDKRDEYAGTSAYSATTITANEGVFASLYLTGKSGAFGFTGEIGFTEAELNGFNTWSEDWNYTNASMSSTTGSITAGAISQDLIGSADNGFGGYFFPNYQIDKLNLGLNLGFTVDGFVPDRAFGFVMLGGTDNSWITAQQIGVGGDWLWAGLVANYAISDALKLTGNIVYADIDAWSAAGDGPGWTNSAAQVAGRLDSAWELSAVLQYTIVKGANVFFSAGYLAPSFELSTKADDPAYAFLTRFEIAF
jgi:hypothetical protein